MHVPTAPAAHGGAHRPTESEPRPTQRTLKRIFEPIPNSVLYLVGLAVVLLVMSPFWIYLVQERFSRKTILYSDDAVNLPVPPPVGTNVSEPALEPPHEQSEIALDQFHGIHLDAPRDDLQRRFSLRLQNTRGMAPEIYEASKVGDIERLRAHFYGGALKEFSLVLRQQRVSPDSIEKELREQFGEPKDVAEADNTTKPAGFSGALSAASFDEEFEKMQAAFPRRRLLTWADAQNHVEATVYYTSTDPAQNVSMLELHISAFAWLDANRPRLGAPSAPPSSSRLDQPVQSSAPTPTHAESPAPKRLFP
jgi:hypothetical protein